MALPLLKISENQRFLVTEAGEGFFWLGDTAWELFHRLTREEAEQYLRNRSELEFNVVQAVALPELGGLEEPNRYGRRPLLKNEKGEYDPLLPDLEGEYGYWDHVDYIIDLAWELGMYIALLPTWGDKFNKAQGKGPEIFTEVNAAMYGEWIAKRYADRTNIVWVMGGDRHLTKQVHANIVREMAYGVRRVVGHRHLISYHPVGAVSSSKYFHYEPWLDFNMHQSCHMNKNIENDRMIRSDYNNPLVKPVMDGEPRYEDHPVGFKPTDEFFVAYDVRQAAYWSVFAGAFGHTYGHHSIWCMCTEPTERHLYVWQDALQQPGGAQMRHLRRLIESRPFLERVPDDTLIAGPQPHQVSSKIIATRGDTYSFIYSSSGETFRAVMGIIDGDRVKAQWFDPREGTYQEIGEFPNHGIVTFTPPSIGRTHDWVLVLDSI